MVLATYFFSLRAAAKRGAAKFNPSHGAQPPLGTFLKLISFLECSGLALVLEASKRGAAKLGF